MKRPIRRDLTLGDVQRLLRQVSPGLRAIIETMVATGVRIGEMLAISASARRALRAELEAGAGRAQLRAVSFIDFRRLAVAQSKKTGRPLRALLRKGGK